MLRQMLRHYPRIRIGSLLRLPMVGPGGPWHPSCGRDDPGVWLPIAARAANGSLWGAAEDDVLEKGCRRCLTHLSRGQE